MRKYKTLALLGRKRKYAKPSKPSKFSKSPGPDKERLRREFDLNEGGYNRLKRLYNSYVEHWEEYGKDHLKSFAAFVGRTAFVASGAHWSLTKAANSTLRSAAFVDAKYISQVNLLSGLHKKAPKIIKELARYLKGIPEYKWHQYIEYNPERSQQNAKVYTVTTPSGLEVDIVFEDSVDEVHLEEVHDDRS